MDCHTRQLCANCHKYSRPPSHGPKWLKNHATKNTAACDACHGKSSCDTCHRKGSSKPTSHDATWPKTHGKAAKTDRKECLMCHENRYCVKCHGLELPHPKDWGMGGHKKSASLKAGSMCYKCHETKYCAMCHPQQ